MSPFLKSYVREIRLQKSYLKVMSPFSKSYVPKQKLCHPFKKVVSLGGSVAYILEITFR